MIVFCTTAKGRTNHLSRTLPLNIAGNPEAKFVVLSYNDQDSLADYIRTNHSHDMNCGRLVFYQFKDAVPFQMAKAKNMAHRLGIAEGGDILVNLDADNFAGEGFAAYISNQFSSSEGIFLWSKMIKEGEGRLDRGISGRIAMTRNEFLLAGGYHEVYENHSPDDKDMHLRLCRLGLVAKEIAPKFLNAIRHTNKMRYREYPEAAYAVAEDFDIKPSCGVVNDGKIGCGTVWRNFDPTPIKIGPVPTRIFGIGLHKTATTSLHMALKILGFKSGHWQNAHWAKAIWREMNQAGKSPTLEKFYALSDLPIPLLFRRLDAAYPGSKFILTTRDEWKWLDSVERHWSPAFNKFRTQWDNDPFSHRVHQILYGRSDFHSKTFLARYRRHNAEVMEYFKDRPSDLLVMDMETCSGWKELCGFLGALIPREPYPSQYVTNTEYQI